MNWYVIVLVIFAELAPWAALCAYTLWWRSAQTQQTITGIIEGLR